MTNEQSKKCFLNNQNLFSKNYLEYHLPAISMWKEQKEKAEKAFKEIKEVYEKTKNLKLGSGQEAELEDKFIRPVLSALGFVYNVQPVTKRGFKKKKPDYALFKDTDSHKEASRYKDDLKKFFSKSLSILEAKYWGRRLNDTDKNDILDSRDPTAQTVKYLEDVHYHTDGKINWAILTNGKHWRLFYYRAASRSGNFFEVDLEEIIKRDRSDDFLYFFLFFSRDAFISDPVTGKLWLDRHREGSESYARAVSDKLKDLIFDEVFEGLAAGFVHYRKTELSIKKETDVNRNEIFKGCLTLLYRLLFLLYAESRNLLPVDEDGYKNVSLLKLKEDINKDIKRLGPGKISKRSYAYWARLEGLCNIIAQGDPALNVPVYNGGLFETKEDCFLANHKMSDYFFAGAVEVLTIDHTGEYPPEVIPFIDYSSLSVRHLGDIYEGLLEFHLQIADEDTVEIKEKGKSIWKKASEIKKGIRTFRRKEKGDIYIENSKHERKATGSYYTPHYIVEYIVKHTVGPVLEERLKMGTSILSELEKLYQKQQRQLKKPKNWKHWEHPREPKGKHIHEILKKEKEVFETIFNIKILDPAMGSGHFLVHTVDFISDKIVSFLADYPDNPVIRRIHEMRDEIFVDLKRQGVKIDESKLTEVNLIKRMVMKRSIYGVDLNDMAVELTKLSLWLDSFTLGAPLSFLDHHLKFGNSLIGAKLTDLEEVFKGEIFNLNLEPLKRAIGNILFVSELSDSTHEQVLSSSEKYREADSSLQGYRILLDLTIANHFGIQESKGVLATRGCDIDLNNLKKSIESFHERDKKIIDQTEAIAKEKRFFHWEIEFPEVFYEQTGEFKRKVDKKENPGFDCVIGNPPYIPTEDISREDSSFYNRQFKFAYRKYETSVLFMGFGTELLKSKGNLGMIIPVAWQTGENYIKFRKAMLSSNVLLSNLINLPFDVFPEAYIDTCIAIFIKRRGFSKTFLYIAKEYDKRVSINDISSEMYDAKKIPIRHIMNSSDYKIYMDISKYELQEKMRNEHIVTLGSLTKSNQGIVESFFSYSNIKKKDYHLPYLKGQVYRYQFIKELNMYIDMSSSKNLIQFYNVPRILIRRIVSRSDRLMATYEIEKFVSKKDVNPFIITGKDYSPYYILANINSHFHSFMYVHFSTIAVKDDFRQTTLAELNNLPIRKISFNTSEKERNKNVDKAIKFFSNSNLVDILKWLEFELSKNRTDTIHDLLAYLAEQMIEMNKKKNKETKGFLKWFEREIGTEIENLSNKTALKEYHNHDFNKLLEVLKKNKNKISIDPSERKTQERLEKEYSKSLSVLTPLKERIQKTDDLIDEMVYKLYDLTPGEIKIVEGKECK